MHQVSVHVRVDPLSDCNGNSLAPWRVGWQYTNVTYYQQQQWDEGRALCNLFRVRER